jgi:hypothetical protein
LDTEQLQSLSKSITSHRNTIITIRYTHANKMSLTGLDRQRRSEKAAADEKLQPPEESSNFLGTNGNPKQKPDHETHLSDDVEPAPVASLPPGSGDGGFPEGGARAWSVAAGATGIIFCSLGYCNAFGYVNVLELRSSSISWLTIDSIFQNYYLTHQLSNKTPSQISWIGSLQVFFLLSGNVIGGPLFDRFGGNIVWPPAVMFVFSVMITSLCKEYYQFILCQGILGGVSMGMM